VKLLLPLLIAAATLSAADVSSRPLRRYLVASASNDGGPGKTPLRFAGDDARGVVATMRSVGGVAPGEVELVLEPDTGRFLSTLREVSGRMALSRDSGYRVELVLYYSGHSDEEGLLLGSTRLRYRELRRVLEQSPADVRLAVLDACASGAALRAKGGVRRQAFQVEGSDRLRGQAYLTSSRAEEASQESDKLGGSVFTHAFLAGVRGAADADGDGRVTLLEAYRYAYRETVEKTSSTRVGPQHPEFDLDLSGSGDVVLSDLAQAGAVLELAGDLRGRIRVSDSTGAVAADLEHLSGRNLPLGLPAGTWRVMLTDSAQSRAGSVVLASGSRQVVGLAGLDSVLPRVAVAAPSPDTTTKSETIGATASASTKTDSVSFLHVPLNLGIAPPATINSMFRDRRITNNLSLDVFVGEDVDIDGFQVSGGLARATQVNGFQSGGLVALSSGRVEGFQTAGLWASLEGGLRGFQAAGLAAWSKGPLDGLQSAGLASLGEGPVRGLQTAGLLTWNRGTFLGLQSAGLASGNEGRMRGVQAAGLYVYGTQAVQGIQAAGVSTWSDGEVEGLQAAGVFAYAGSSRGLQVSVVNVSGSVTGAQVGVVNVAGSVNGTQIGVVNLAGKSEGIAIGVVNLAREFGAFPLGLVNLGADMKPGLDVALDEAGWGSLAFRFEGMRFHSRLGATARLDDPTRRLGSLFGFGAHWLLDKNWRIDADLASRNVWRDREQGGWVEANWNSVSVSVGRKMGPIRVSGGLSCNVLAADRRGDVDGFVGSIFEDGASNGYVKLWPGAFVSLSL
jgi:hypothetical protein